MATSEYLSSVKIGGTEYDIYAKSALSAGWVPASAINGQIDGSAISGHISANVISAVPASALPVIPTSAISDTSISWSALAPHTDDSGSSATNKLWTPCATREYVTDYVAGKISNVYKFKGSITVGDLKNLVPENGDVYNITDNDTINEGTLHAVRVYNGDNVAWVSGADGGWWDKLASVDTNGKLDVTAFENWSSNSASEFAGSAASATTSWVTMNVSGNDGTPDGKTASADGYSLIQSAMSGASAWKTITAWSADGKPISTSGGYLVGDGTNSAKLALVEPEKSIGASTPTTALVNAQGISSYVDSNYIAKRDIKVETHQLVIDNT